MLWKGNSTRHRVIRRVATLGTAIAAAVTVVGAGAPGVSGAAPPRAAPTIDWSSCAGDATAQCGTLSVPVDWDHPTGPRFDLALARRTATDPAARVGSLVFGPGGPGDSGVSRVVTGVSRFSAELRRRFDIVSFDPRGVGQSSPVRCSTELLGQRPAPVLTSQADFDATVAYNRRLREDCRARTGPVFDHVDTLSMARDLDAVRAALGETELTYHGSSYGTLLGEQYAELFPHRVRAMVLESVVDHSLDTRAFLNTQTATAQDSFDAFVAWCDRTESCALYGRDISAIWADLLDRAGRGEVPDPKDPSATLSPYALSGFLAPRALYGPDWAGLAGTISTLSGQAASGAGPAPATDSTEEAVRTSSNPLAIFCQDWSLPVRDYREYARRIREMARIGTDLPYPQALAVVESCLGAPAVDNPQHRLRVRTDRPLLLINSRHDPAAGHNWASNVARQLGTHGVLLTYEGAGHGSYNASPCMTGAVDRYLISTITPAPGASCPAVEPTPSGAG
ncbi:alpha/beta fold hydrolase [Plantactinospora solaniradicis]|uniref:Alpha/beta fold hydrolase n=1 Tax=Plantactinospora solaniradicis TaxID=1723736 RepID=A0ABW1KC23_9ACTN